MQNFYSIEATMLLLAVWILLEADSRSRWISPVNLWKSADRAAWSFDETDCFFCGGTGFTDFTEIDHFE